MQISQCVRRKRQATGIRDRDKVRIGRLRSRWNARNLKNEWGDGKCCAEKSDRASRCTIQIVMSMRNAHFYGRSGETGHAQKGEVGGYRRRRAGASS